MPLNLGADLPLLLIIAGALSMVMQTAYAKPYLFLLYCTPKFFFDTKITKYGS